MLCKKIVRPHWVRVRRRRQGRSASFALLAVAAIWALPNPATRADVFTWTNANHDGFWPVSGNWSENGNPSSPPGPTDTALFDDTGGGGNVFMPPQSPNPDPSSLIYTIDTLEFANSNNGYTLQGTVSSGQIDVNTIDASETSNSGIANTINSSMSVVQGTPGQALQIFTGPSLLEIDSGVFAPDGLNIQSNSGYSLTLSSTSSSIGATVVNGATLNANTPDVLRTMSSLQLGGFQNFGSLEVDEVDGENATGLAPISVPDGNNSSIQITPRGAAPTLGAAGFLGLTSGSASFQSLSLGDQSTVRLSSFGTPYSLGFGTLSLNGAGTVPATILTQNAEYFSGKSQVTIGSITDNTGTSSLNFDGGGAVTIAADASNYAGATQILSGLVTIDSGLALGTGPVTVSGSQNGEVGGAIELNTHASEFPSSITVGAFGALGGTLANAIYSGAGQNVFLTSTDAILFPTDGSPIPRIGPIGGAKAYWLGVSASNGSYGETSLSSIKGFALGAFTPDGGFYGSLGDNIANNIMQIHASGFIAIGQIEVDSNGIPTTGGQEATFSSLGKGVDLTWDGTGGELAIFQPIQSVRTLGLTDSSPGSGFFALETTGTVASNQTFNVESGSNLYTFYQGDDVQGTVNIESGGNLLHSQTPTGATSGTFNILEGGEMTIFNQAGAPGHGATYNWSAGSIVFIATTSIDTGDASQSSGTWISPNSDVLVDGAMTVNNSVTRGGITLGAGRRLITDFGATINSGGDGVTVADGTPQNSTIIFAAASNQTLDVEDDVSMPNQILQINDTSNWTPNALINLQQNGTVILGGNVTAGTLDILAGNLQIGRNANVTVTQETVGAGATLSGSGSSLHAQQIDVYGTISPGFSPGAYVTTGNVNIHGGAGYLWQINDPAGTAGNENNGWDVFETSGSVSFADASAEDPLTMDLQTLDSSNNPDLLANFDPTKNYSWVILQSGGLTGFSSADFAIDASQFQNTFGGTFAVVQDPENADNLDLVYTAPVPEPASLSLLMGGGILLARRRRRRA